MEGKKTKVRFNSMRQVYLEFPVGGYKVTATLQEEVEKELVNRFWDAADGSEFICCHPFSAGYSFNAQPLPGPHFPCIPSETPWTLCEMNEGQLHYDGYRFRCTYGPVTEPMTLNYGIVANVDPECLDDFKKACMKVWEYMVYYHKTATIILSKKED